jgi:hypothetical protein
MDDQITRIFFDLPIDNDDHELLLLLRFPSFDIHLGRIGQHLGYEFLMAVVLHGWFLF